MRLIGVVMMAVAALLAVAALAIAQGSEVRISGSDGETSDVSLSDLGDPSIEEREYAVRSPQGERTEEVTGYPLGDVLSQGGYDSFSFEEVSVQRPNGSRIKLGPEEIRNTGDVYPDGPPAVFIDEQGETGFIRPSSGSSDVNSSDFFTVPSGPLEVEVLVPDEIEIEIDPSATKTKAGERIDFGVDVVSAPDSGNLEFRWQFGDGNGDTGPTTRHEFEEAGSYVVVVTAEDAESGEFNNDTVTVEVGKPKEEPKDEDEDDPDRKGGGDDDDGFESGAYDGSTGTPSTTYTAPTPAPAPAPAAPAPETPAPAPKPEEPVAATDPAERVVGELLGASSVEVLPAAPAEEEKEKPPSLRSGTPDQDQGGTSLSGAMLASATVLGLLGVGAFTELGGPLRGPGGLRSRMPWPRIPRIPRGPFGGGS